MRTRFQSCAALALFALSVQAGAAALTPYQQTALNKMLAQVPAEQRAMVRPQMEAMVSRLGKAEIDMMMAKMGAAQKEEAREDSGDGEWGKAEADYQAAFPKVQAYIARVSDTRDRMTAHWEGVLKSLEDEYSKARSNSFVDRATFDACQHALNLVPSGRAKIPGLEQTHAEQDRIMTRMLVENRADYRSVEAYAKMLGQPVDSEMVAPVRYHWSAPLAEGGVQASLSKLDGDMAALLEANTRELHRIYTKGYADQGSGVVSKLQERDLQAQRDKAAKAAVALCAPANEAYTRGLVQFLAPVAAKRKH